MALPIDPVSVAIGIGLGMLLALLLLPMVKAKGGKVNPSIDKSSEKVATVMTLADVSALVKEKGGTAALCRCWRSKTFPLCDGSHGSYNKECGDNVGPLVIKAGDTGASKKDAGAAKKDDAPKKEKEPKKEKAPKKGEEATAPAAEDPAKKLKKVVKEGGKRGVEIEGAADMGGLQFFSTSVDEPEGDLDLLVESMKAMNNQPDPLDEERKGCSGHIGKMIFSAGTEQLAVVAYVPEEKQAELSCEEWLKTVLGNFGGEVTSSSASLCQGRVLTDGNKNIFPLKIREPMLLESNNFLRKKGLFPEDKDSDDDMVFGDDDFPS